MEIVTDQDGGWGSRRKYLIVLLCQLINPPMLTVLPNDAIKQGATGYMLGYLLSYFACGIPLLYMEFIISQFSARDSIDVWKVRPCLSHIGYILMIWQVLLIINNHVIVSFIFHYILLSFENPIPYYTCGFWATKDCNIILNNYTVIKDCTSVKNQPAYCNSLHITLPEYQHWNYNMLRINKQLPYHIAWPVCLASALIGAITFFSIFKRKKSINFVITFYIFYPILGYTLLLMGSMLQKGVIEVYEKALDTDFTVFFRNFRLSSIIMQVINNLGVGSGFSFNLGSSSSFRTPCYSNTVIAVVSCAIVSALSVSTTAMITCPLAYKYSIDPVTIVKTNMTFVFEKIPKYLYEYQNKNFWIILTLSSHVVLGMSTNVIFIHHLLEMLSTRYLIVKKCPGLTALLVMISIYFITIPFLGHFGINALIGVRRFVVLVATFVALLEILNFVVWYGLNRFAEDVHFMQGIQPKKIMKIAWLYSGIALCYGFCDEIYIKVKDYNGTLCEIIGWGIFLVTMVLLVGICVIKLLIAACNKKFGKVIRFDSTWGPKDELLQRSRAMFTAEAMTKEYMYRQYHLQAGVLFRQRTSNCRTERNS